jgi:toxin-antitoxin system PIN domain toxin
MILPDVNVLIYAFRADVREHPVCASWLNGIVNGNALFGISPLALSVVVRITTTPSIYPHASTTAEAFRFCEAILAQPNCQIVEPGSRHFDIFKRLCAKTGTRGAKVTDAWYAALAIEWGCEWVTLDRDYARFPGLKFSAPTA